MARIVTLASKTGSYGGPFDTAVRQTLLARAEGWDATVVAAAFPGDEAISQEIRTAHARHVLNLNNFQDVFSWKILTLLLRETRHATVSHISLSREMVPIAALTFARLFRKSVVAQPHGMLTSRTSLPHKMVDALLLRPLLGKRATVIALTPVERQALLRWSPRLTGQVTVLGNPPPIGLAADPRPEGYSPSGDVVFIARLHPRKRVRDYVNAAEISASLHENISYSVVGPDEGDLPVVLNSSALGSSLTYEGATDSTGVLERLKRSDVFVLCSESEPWGNVLVAALALNRPVVVTESSALAGWVSEFGAGAVVPDRDPLALATAVAELMSPETYRRATRGAERLAAAHFEPARTGLQLSRIYSAE